jgi:hypothetical protein
MSSPQPTPYPLRMPEELRARLEDLAKSNRRSLQAEIVALLEEALDARSSGKGDVDALAENIAERVVAKLKQQ